MYVVLLAINSQSCLELMFKKYLSSSYSIKSLPDVSRAYYLEILSYEVSNAGEVALRLQLKQLELI